MDRRSFTAALAAAGWVPPAAAQAQAPEDAVPAVTGRWVHAWNAYGLPKYGPDYKHFDHVNPDAPKRGTLVLANPDRRTSFDKFNYFTLRGNAPAGVMHWMHETLCQRGADEPMAMYGLLAEAMLVADDRGAVTFRLHPLARFSNGAPVLAEDVKYSFESLSGPLADPGWQARYAGVARCVVLDERTLRFELKTPSQDTLFNLGTMLPVFSRQWAPGKPFDKIVTEYPLCSGPYLISLAESGRRIEFTRRKDYWAADLPVRRGFFNFDRVVYRYYEDEDIATEAFKAGEYDFLRAFGSGIFVRRHTGPKWEDGRIVKARLKTGAGTGLQSYQFNLRRPLFQDLRVRRALNLAYDLDNLNRYKMLDHAYSVFSGTEFAAEGTPSPGELALLSPFRDRLPPEVFGPAWRPPRTDTSLGALRQNLLAARALLEQAGWKLGPDRVLRNAKGEPFEFEFLAPGESTVGELIWQRTLEKLGIKLKIRRVDFALYERRVRELEFDILTIVEGQSFTVPSPLDYQRSYHSRNADTKGSDNYRGVKHPAVDAALDAMDSARTLPALRDACRALDRVVMWNAWQIPDVFPSTINVSYWNKFGQPAKRPRYLTVLYTPDLDPLLAWPLLNWWMKDAA